jgi:hypothetical protein
MQEPPGAILRRNDIRDEHRMLGDAVEATGVAGVTTEVRERGRCPRSRCGPPAASAARRDIYKRFLLRWIEEVPKDADMAEQARLMFADGTSLQTIFTCLITNKGVPQNDAPRARNNHVRRSGGQGRRFSLVDATRIAIDHGRAEAPHSRP